MKRITVFLLSLLLVFGLTGQVVSAEDTSRSYDFQLTADGKTEVTATTGQVLTMNLTLKRTDSSEDADMYAMQAEFEYDDTFFELVDNSAITSSGIEWTDMARRTGGRVFYLNFVSLSGGKTWPSELLIGTFQLRVIAETGVSTISAKNCLVSVQDGTDSFSSVCNDVRVIVGTECTVTFVSNGGSEVEAQKVQFGEKIKRPQEPTRAGYAFNGWYSDLDRTQLWDFDTDTVQGNMTLYAGWLEAAEGGSDTVDPGQDKGSFPWWVLILIAAVVVILLVLFGANSKKRVAFETKGGTQLDPIYVKKGSRLPRPMTPSKPGAMFAGWFTDPEGTQPWNFEEDKVEQNMTLYAGWK